MEKRKVIALSTPRKLMLFFLLGLTILLLANDILLYKSTNDLLHEVEQSTAYEGKNMLDWMNEQFSQIHSVLLNLLDDNDINSISKFPAFMDDYQRARSLSRIQQKISLIGQCNPLVETVSIFIPKEKLILNSGGRQGTLTHLTSWQVENLSQFINEQQFPLCTENGILKMIICPAGSAPEAGLPYAIIVTFSADNIANACKSRVSLKDNALYMLEIKGIPVSLQKNWPEKLNELLSREEEGNMNFIRWNNEEHIVFHETDINYDMHYFAVLQATSFLSGVRTTSSISIIISILVIAIGSVFFITYFHMIDKPLLKLTDAFSHIEHDNLGIRLETPLKNEFAFLFQRFNAMVEHMQELIDTTYKQKQYLLEAELKQLEEQTNPHFLYNSYFLLHRMIKSRDWDRAGRLSQELGKYLKYITRNGQNYVAFNSEYEHAQMYTQIQTERFGDRIQVQFGAMPDKADNILVPRLIIQPLIENSFTHGVRDTEKEGRIQVSFSLDSKFLKITVEDNGNELTDDMLEELKQHVLLPTSTEITGLLNISRRFQLLYGTNNLINVYRSGLGGLQVTLRIPLQMEDTYETVGS